MSRTQKFFFAFLAILFLAWWLWPRGEDAESAHWQGVDAAALDSGDLSPLVNRVWIDHIPSNERDKIDVFAMLDEPRIGAFSRSSAYEGDWTSFDWGTHGGLHFRMLQKDKTHKVSAAIMKGAKCAPFDYCMKLKGVPRAAKKYGSMEDWIIQDEITPHEFIRDFFFAKE